MSLTDFLIYSLATWRIASFLVQEAGPWNVFIRLREKTGIVHNEDGKVLIVPDGFFAGVLSCMWCTSVWVAFGWGIFLFFTPEISFWFATIFGFSAMAIVLNKAIN